jgi:hypothetical protein
MHSLGGGPRRTGAWRREKCLPAGMLIFCLIENVVPVVSSSSNESEPKVFTTRPGGKPQVRTYSRA